MAHLFNLQNNFVCNFSAVNGANTGTSGQGQLAAGALSFQDLLFYRYFLLGNNNNCGSFLSNNHQNQHLLMALAPSLFENRQPPGPILAPLQEASTLVNNTKSNLTTETAADFSNNKPLDLSRTTLVPDNKSSANNSKRWPCRFCSTTWASPNGMRRHEREYHNVELQREVGAGTAAFTCDQCKKPFCSKTALITHMSRSKTCAKNRYHDARNACEEQLNTLSNISNDRSNSSFLDGQTSDSGLSMTLADNSSPLQGGNSNSTKKFRCSYCPAVCSAMTTLRIHERHNHSDKLTVSRPYVCRYCSQRFVNLQGLNVHIAKSTACRAVRGLAEQQL